MMKISEMVEKGYIFTIHVTTGQNSPQKKVFEGLFYLAAILKVVLSGEGIYYLLTSGPQKGPKPQVNPSENDHKLKMMDGFVHVTRTLFRKRPLSGTKKPPKLMFLT